ncbi:MAG TPA: creatininase family protein [Vicinamibacterales bacterium]|nr:creatininase family protein [Vicinamibacterales bacterium]
MSRYALTTCAAVLVTTIAVVSAQNPPPQATPQTAPQGRGRQGGRGPAQPPRMPPPEFFSRNTPKDLVEFELMTWPEVYRAIHEQGKTVALIYFGGTESRGPQNVNGGHTLMGRAIVKAIALKLGNAIALPVIPYSQNNASAQTTGTIGLTGEIQGALCEQIAEQAIATGFTTVAILNDHGGGTNVYGQVAKKLEEKYRAPELASRNIHVLYADTVYAKAQDDFDTWLKEHNLPVSGHAGIPDTSTMMYLQDLEKKPNAYTRLDLLPVAVTVPNPTDPNAPRPVASGVTGDGRQSDVKYGKMAMDIKIDYAVKQIQAFLAANQK